MKEGSYIVNENGNDLGIIKFSGVEPFMALIGSFDLVAFTDTGQTKQLQTTIINDIKLHPAKYSFTLLSEYKEKVVDIKIKDLIVPQGKIAGYIKFLESTNDQTGLIMKVMSELKFEYSEACAFIEKHIK